MYLDLPMSPCRNAHLKRKKLYPSEEPTTWSWVALPTRIWWNIWKNQTPRNQLKRRNDRESKTGMPKRALTSPHRPGPGDWAPWSTDLRYSEGSISSVCSERSLNLPEKMDTKRRRNTSWSMSSQSRSRTCLTRRMTMTSSRGRKSWRGSTLIRGWNRISWPSSSRAGGPLVQGPESDAWETIPQSSRSRSWSRPTCLQGQRTSGLRVRPPPFPVSAPWIPRPPPLLARNRMAVVALCLLCTNHFPNRDSITGVTEIRVRVELMMMIMMMS